MPTRPALKSGSALRPTCTYVPEPLRPVMMLLGSTVCVLLAADARPRRAAGCRSSSAFSAPLCGMPFGKMSVIGTSRAIEKTLKPVKTSLTGGAARAGDAAEIVAAQVDEIEDALFVELIGIVELAGDDPAAVGQRVDVRVDERLIVETLLRGWSGSPES